MVFGRFFVVVYSLLDDVYGVWDGVLFLRLFGEVPSCGERTRNSEGVPIFGLFCE